MEDNAIIDLYWQRSEQAIRETEKKYGKMCFALANRLLMSPEDAEECVNDAYLGVWNSIPPARPHIFSSFVAKIVRNTAMNRLTYYNAEKRSANLTLAYEELEECLPSSSIAENDVEFKELVTAVTAFLDRQDYISRNIFLRRYWFFDSVHEIAKRFVMTDGAVKLRLHRCRKKLAEHLKKEGLINEF